jgi:uncharacterized protein YuzE
VKILEGHDPLTRSYDEDADVLYLSLGGPRPALGVDIGDGVIVRYAEGTHEVVGVTLLGIRSKLLQQLSDEG